MKDVEPLQIQRDILTVSQLNRRARQLLETHLPLLWVEGEISNFARPSSGHWYFTLKDANAQVKCAMFRNRNQAVRQLPQHGQQVLVRGRVSLYEGRGDYQMIVEHLEDAGFGALQRAFEQLKHKLLQEGLFDPAYKQPLPRLPRHIGIITSPTGAAIRDILHVLQRRFPAIPVSLFPVAVQGSAAAGEIVAALQLANAQSDCDVLIVGRGGGSLEDLWPFNEESVARAIFASRIPVISAVGHEVDTTIADFVADLRAPTPSAAAELCTPDGNEMLQQFARYQQLLLRAINTRIREDCHRLSARSSRLQHPAQRLQAQAQHLDNLEIRLRQAVQARLQRLAVRLDNLAGRCQQENPGTRVETLVKQVEQLGRRLNASVQQVLQLKRQALGQQSALLDSVNPLSVLQRGYSLTSDTSGKVIRSSTDINSGDQIITRLGSGKLVSTVDTVE